MLPLVVVSTGLSCAQMAREWTMPCCENGLVLETETPTMLTTPQIRSSSEKMSAAWSPLTPLDAASEPAWAINAMQSTSDVKCTSTYDAQTVNW